MTDFSADLVAPPNSMTRHYLVCALWSSTDDQGTPLDEKYSVADFTAVGLARAAQDCKAFCLRAAALLAAADLSEEQLGHDFWLTRNGHGTGFWDRGLPTAIGEGLTAIAHEFGELHLYADARGRLDFE